MGTWGPGVFDNDGARDVLDDVLETVDTDLRGFAESDRVGIEDLGDTLACVAIKIALIERCEASPAPEDARALREKFLAIYDREIDGFRTTEDFKKRRRVVLEGTLDEFVGLAAARD